MNDEDPNIVQQKKVFPTSNLRLFYLQLMGIQDNLVYVCFDAHINLDSSIEMEVSAKLEIVQLKLVMQRVYANL